MHQNFIGLRNIPWNYLTKYFTTPKSLFRIYQDQFVSKIGKDLTDSVIEVGGETKYNHSSLFPNAKSFKVTNVNRDYEDFLDITKITLPDNSEDCYLCVSVLEHVFEFREGISEMRRTLKQGGRLIIVVPFSYPIHDEVDYWRFSPDSLRKLLDGFELEDFTVLGGKYSTFANVLQRPKRDISVKYLLMKLVGLAFLFFGKIREKHDGFPLGYGVCAIKK